MKTSHMFIPFCFAVITCCLLSACLYGKAPAHDAWTILLNRHVSANGKVDYKGFQKDSTMLNDYLRQLSASTPDENSWSENEQKAFWINAYNAFTIKLILTYFPIKSIKDIGSLIKVNGVSTPWEIPFFSINKEKLDLSILENIKLRKKFEDPRIHFALVCASKSCPALLNEAFEPSKLDRQLDTQTKVFLSDPFKNKILEKAPELSKIFEWYAADFIKKGSVVDFVNRYASRRISPGAKIIYLNYNWALND